MNVSTLAVVVLVCIAGIYLWMKIGKYAMQLIGVLLLIMLGLAFAFIHTFQAFSQQTKIATVHCSMVANKSHTMVLDMNGESYTLEGDRWQLQSSVVEVQPWLQFLGVKSGYTLDRLDSQFDDPNHENVRPIQLGGFSLYKSTDAWMFFPLIRSAYGNGVIQNCDGRTYNVFVDANGDMSANRA